VPETVDGWKVLKLPVLPLLLIPCCLFISCESLCYNLSWLCYNLLCFCHNIVAAGARDS
jgi:hypothetical protein